MREARYVNFGPMQQWRSHCWPGEFAFSDGDNIDMNILFLILFVWRYIEIKIILNEKL